MAAMVSFVSLVMAMMPFFPFVVMAAMLTVVMLNRVDLEPLCSSEMLEDVPIFL